LLSNVGPHAEEGKEHGLGIEPKKWIPVLSQNLLTGLCWVILLLWVSLFIWQMGLIFTCIFKDQMGLSIHKHLRTRPAPEMTPSKSFLQFGVTKPFINCLYQKGNFVCVCVCVWEIWSANSKDTMYMQGKGWVKEQLIKKNNSYILCLIFLCFWNS
jgi:hypothetical protein